MSVSIIRIISGNTPFDMLKLKKIAKLNPIQVCRGICTTPILEESRQAGKFKVSKYGTTPLTYEQFLRPREVAHTKTWNSWNTSNLEHSPKPGETTLRPGETAVEDMLIRRFVTGTWHNLISSEIIVNRQFNIIRVAMLVYQGLHPRKMYFLIGYSEELLSYILQCPVKLELQTISDRRANVFKYV